MQDVGYETWLAVVVLVSVNIVDRFKNMESFGPKLASLVTIVERALELEAFGAGSSSLESPSLGFSG